ncbi:MAG TPA: MBL fold metallo-hydrolase [Pilimelia sp.]|nr:MBL fold metallo-hydrolase [Pilimelia sp.]
MLRMLGALGGAPRPADLDRLRASPRYRDGRFRLWRPGLSVPGAGAPDPAAALHGWRGGPRRPWRRIPVVRTPPAGGAPGLRVTWLGHASTLVECAGGAVLLDPVFSRRCSPVPGVGPRRLHRPPRALRDLPALSAVVISHDHYDHLDMRTVRRLAAAQPVSFVVPLGVGAHLRRWGVPEARVAELDWGERVRYGELTLTAVPAQHHSGRTPARNRTLWAGWVVAGAGHRVYHAGDTGYFPELADLGAAHGPFDVTLLPVGGYDPMWPDALLTPEQAVRAHRALGGRLLLPVRWATFPVGRHPWREPADRVVAAAARAGVPLAVPRPGEAVDPAQPPPMTPWWAPLRRAHHLPEAPLTRLLADAAAA